MVSDSIVVILGFTSMPYPFSGTQYEERLLEEFNITFKALPVH